MYGKQEVTGVPKIRHDTSRNIQKQDNVVVFIGSQMTISTFAFIVAKEINLPTAKAG